MGQQSKVKMKNGCNCIITETNFTKARELIKAQKKDNKLILFVSEDDDLSRKILEKAQIDILVILQSKRKDYQKQRNSGFNQVLAKIAKKHKIQIGICLDEIINSEGKKKADILARIKQNIKLCSKNKLSMKFCGESVNKKSIYDLKALGLSLGMPTSMVKNLF